MKSLDMNQVQEVNGGTPKILVVVGAIAAAKELVSFGKGVYDGVRGK